MNENMNKNMNENAKENTFVPIGSWNESGSIRSLDRKGFTPTKCGSEVIANSWDAGSRKATFRFAEREDGRRIIKLVDIGQGMDFDDLRNMFDIYRSNNDGKQSMGVSGLGGKEASYILSKKRNVASTVCYYTKKRDNPYYKAIVPWGEIFEKLEFKGKIKVEHMIESEIAQFCKDREEEYCDHGTTIEWDYSPEFRELLDIEFYDSLRKTNVAFKDRWDVIFGLTGMQILLDKSDGRPPVDLKLYNYFSGEDNEYYIEKRENTIEHYQDQEKQDHFVMSQNGNLVEFARTKRGVNKTLTPCNPLRSGWNLVAEYTVYLGLRKNKVLFDEQCPRMPNSASLFLCDYDSKFFSEEGQRDTIREELSKVGVFRNEQFITNFHLEGIKAGSARANWQSALKIFHMRCEVRYATLSSQDNAADIAMGIQENKNQNQDAFPLPFVRLVSYLKGEFYNEIVQHFKDVCEASKPKSKPLPKPSPSITLDSDSESESSESSCSNDDDLSVSSSEIEKTDELAITTPVSEPEPNYREMLMQTVSAIVKHGDDGFIQEILRFISTFEKGRVK